MPTKKQTTKHKTTKEKTQTLANTQTLPANETLLR